MKFVFHTNCVSPHQLPLANELVNLLGVENYRYVFTEALTGERVKLGWSSSRPEWCIHIGSDEAREWLETADVCLSGLRDVALFDRRYRAGLTTFYTSERWFKPPFGILRLLHPRYFKMARAVARLLKGNGTFQYLPMGVWAARDMARLCGLMSGDWRCLFRAPKLNFDCRPGGKITAVNGRDARYCLNHMRLWGYFVAPSQHPSISNLRPLTSARALRVLWVGRMLALKRVDTIIRAVYECSTVRNVALTLIGNGPEKSKLQALNAKMQKCYHCADHVEWRDSVPIDKVREAMRGHDVYVMSSNGYEGWGAVVSEALEENMMSVIGTYESGACATLLRDANLYHAGDWKALSRLLANPQAVHGIGDWTAKNAAKILIKEVAH